MRSEHLGWLNFFGSEVSLSSCLKTQKLKGIYFFFPSVLFLITFVLSCTYLSTLAQSCPLLHSLVYSCTVLFILAQSCLFLHSLVYSCTVLFIPAQSCLFLHRLVYSCTVLFIPAQSCVFFTILVYFQLKRCDPKI